jgi:hypothetical protein
VFAAAEVDARAAAHGVHERQGERALADSGLALERDDAAAAAARSRQRALQPPPRLFAFQ